jgi:hypothetical protein
MPADSDFKVRFDRQRGLTYKDAIGTLLFSYDFAFPDGKKIIIYKAALTGDLKPISSSLSGPEQARLQLAFERVKQYVISCGYKIHEDTR